MKIGALFFASVTLTLLHGAPVGAALASDPILSAHVDSRSTAGTLQGRLEQIRGELGRIELRLDEQEQLWDRYLFAEDFTAARQVRRAQERLLARKELLEREREELLAQQKG